MVEGMERMGREAYQGSEPRAFGTNPDNPPAGRIFVWTQAGWFEREEGPWGNVVFTPIAESEDELRSSLERDNPDVDLVELEDEYGRMVCEEFAENAEMPLYPEAPETSSQPPFEEQDVT